MGEAEHRQLTSEKCISLTQQVIIQERYYFNVHNPFLSDFSQILLFINGKNILTSAYFEIKSSNK